jgi:hypothetical protein
MDSVLPPGEPASAARRVGRWVSHDGTVARLPSRPGGAAHGGHPTRPRPPRLGPLEPRAVTMPANPASRKAWRASAHRRRKVALDGRTHRRALGVAPHRPLRFGALLLDDPAPSKIFRGARPKMYYLVILLFLTGCATRQQTAEESDASRARRDEIAHCMSQET